MREQLCLLDNGGRILNGKKLVEQLCSLDSWGTYLEWKEIGGAIMPMRCPTHLCTLGVVHIVVQ